MREIMNVRQEPGAGHRRWFEADGLDLVVWFDAAGAIDGFQLCYDLGRGEHALTWRPVGGFLHSVVDAGDENPLKNLSPVLQPVKRIPWPAIVRLFDERAGALEAELQDLVRSRLGEGARAAGAG